MKSSTPYAKGNGYKENAERNVKIKTRHGEYLNTKGYNFTYVKPEPMKDLDEGWGRKRSKVQ